MSLSGCRIVVDHAAKLRTHVDDDDDDNPTMTAVLIVFGGSGCSGSDRWMCNTHAHTRTFVCTVRYW